MTRTSSKAGPRGSVYLFLVPPSLHNRPIGLSVCLMFISCLTHYSYLCMRGVSVCFILYKSNEPALFFLHYLSIWSLLTSLSTSVELFSPLYSWRCFNEGFHLLSTLPTAPLCSFSSYKQEVMRDSRGGSFFLFRQFIYFCVINNILSVSYQRHW